MIKKHIKFTDYNGEEREEDFYFNLNQAEILEMEWSHNGGLTTLLERIVQARDSAQLVSIFKELLLKSYGVKSDDGRRFIKSKELSDEFAHTEAYSVLFTELATDDEAAADFVNGLMPKKANTPKQNNAPEQDDIPKMIDDSNNPASQVN